VVQYHHYSKRIVDESESCTLDELVTWSFAGISPGGTPTTDEHWTLFFDGLVEWLPDWAEFSQFLADSDEEVPGSRQALARLLVQYLNDKGGVGSLAEALEIHDDCFDEPDQVFEQIVDQIELEESDLGTIVAKIGALLVEAFLGDPVTAANFPAGLAVP
jgi:hypothetical protein